MMQSMKEKENEKDDEAWTKMRDRLRVKRAPIDVVKEHADLPRHGKLSMITDAERVRVFTITDEIVRRFLAYLKNGKQALPADAYKELTN